MGTAVSGFYIVGVIVGVRLVYGVGVGVVGLGPKVGASVAAQGGVQAHAAESKRDFAKEN